MSLIVTCLAGLLVCPLPSRVEAGEAAEAVERAVPQVLAAFEAKDATALSALALRIVPDPWLVADALCLRGRRDAAKSFAQAVPAPEGAALLKYLEARGTGPVHAPTRAALGAAEEAMDAMDSVKLAAAVEALQALVYDGDALEQARVRLALGEAQERSGYPGKARVTLQGAGQAAEALGWIQGAASAWSVAGFAAWAEYDADATRRAWERQCAAEQTRASVDGCATALNNLGALSVQVGDYRGAENYFGQAHQVLRRLPADAVQGLRQTLLTNMAEAALRAGRFVRAIDLIEGALVLAGEPVAPDAISALSPEALGALAKALAVKSSIIQKLGDAEEALHVLERVEGIYEHRYTLAKTQSPTAVRDARLDLASARAGHGMHLVDMGRAAEGLPLLEHARTTFRELDAPAERLRVHNNVGLALQAVRRYEDAARAFQEAIEQADAIGDRWAQANAMQNVAELQLLRGNRDAARELHTNALALADAIAAPQLIADGHGGLARVQLAVDQPRKALLHAERGADALVAALAGLATPRGPQARERSATIFEAGIEAALQLKDPVAATRSVERGRAATLLQVLQGREELRDVIVVDHKLLATEREVERNVAEARSLMERAETEARHGATPVSRERARARYQDFRDELGRALAKQEEVTDAVLRASRNAATLLHGQVDDLATIRGRLQPGDVFVSYALAATRLVAVVVRAPDVLAKKDETKDKDKDNDNDKDKGEAVIDLGEQAALDKAMDAIEWTDSGEAITAVKLAALRAILVAPLDLPAGTLRLLIAPAGRLAYLPFGALLPELQIAYVPSGTTYGLLLADAARRGEGVLGVGGPDYTGRSRLPRLDGSAAEIVEVATDPKDRLLGAAATETALRARLATRPRWQAVHFACHGTADPTHPLLSALALTRGKGAGDDGYLTALEVLRLKVPADLTVLSACVTGKGRYFRGEGLVGLPRAFFVAGSPRVIASLWQVNDEATFALMQAFYGRWRPKDPKQTPLPAAEALRRAQADIRRRPGWEHPYYWAAWVLWGVPD